MNFNAYYVTYDIPVIKSIMYIVYVFVKGTSVSIMLRHHWCLGPALRKNTDDSLVYSRWLMDILFLGSTLALRDIVVNVRKRSNTKIIRLYIK